MNQDNEVLVKVSGVSKKFCRDLKKSLWYKVKDIASELLPIQNSKLKIKNSEAALRPGEFWANKDISFELRRGECIGLIGRNGAGKTTLLKMLNGLIKPDEGSIEMRGRVGALIALGAGFNPILTGRENIYVNGSVLGLSKKEIDSKIEEIIDFSEVREFIDSPVQSYSSGMQVRLGFAVATALDPDVLILDEVLAVGDAAFRNKCYVRISQIRKKAAIIFVSHNMEQVGRICDKALFLRFGKALYLGDVEGGVSTYESQNEQGQETDPSFVSMNPPIQSFNCKSSNSKLKTGDPLSLDFEVNSINDLNEFKIRIHIYNQSGIFVADSILTSSSCETSIKKGFNSLRLVVPYIPFRPGIFRASFQILDHQGAMMVWAHKIHEIHVYGSLKMTISDCQLPLKAFVNL